MSLLFKVIDKIVHPWVVSVTGKILCAFGFLLIAPIPLLRIGPSTELCYAGIALIGVGPGVFQVTTIVRSQRAAIAKGFDHDLSTYHLISGDVFGQKCIPYKLLIKAKILTISGLWSSSWFLGAFLGPTVGGFLVERFGFANIAFMYVVFYIFTTFVGIAGVICHTSKPVGYESVKE